MPAIGLIAALAVACSGTGDAPEPTASAPAAAPTQAATAVPAPTETPAPTPVPTPAPSRPEPTATAAQEPDPAADYDSTENMFRLFSGRDHSPDDTLEAITLAIANNDKSMVPLLVELLRFFANRDLLIEASNAISAITGREFRREQGSWNEWMEWLGKNAEEYGPPDGYVLWKSNLMSLIDPRFADFLAPAEQGSRINLFEVAWGGVRPDGIPDLQNAPVITAGEQEYLQPSDRVFGVSINGEHRGLPAAHRQRPRDGQRRAGGRTHRPCLLNALRHRNRVFRQDQRRANHIRHVGDAVPQQQGHVRPA